MRRLLFVALLLVLILPVVAVVAQDSDLPALPDLAGREITVAVENAYPPYNYINENGEAVGWDYDTFRDICRLINCVPVFVETAWDGMLVAIANGEYDVAADGITYTADRDETVDFAQLYQAYDETLLVVDTETRFSTVAELQALGDFLVGTQIGTTNEITANALFEGKVNSFDTFGAAIQALINGDVDAVVVDRPAAEGYIEAQGGLKTLEESLNQELEGLAFAFPAGSDLVAPINAAMDALIASGRWDQIFTRWFVTPELPDLAGREITVAVENAYPPYNYINEAGEAVGWDYDTFNAICAALNCVPVFVETAWDGMLVAISNGEYDVAADGITYTADRDETVDFAQLYQAYDETLLVVDTETRFTNSEELKALPEFLVGTQIGTTNEITANALFEGHVNSFDTFGAAIQALLQGDVDAVVVDRPAAEGYIEAQGGLKTLEESLNQELEGLAFAFPTGSDLVAPVNAAMDWLIASGVWDDIYAKWFQS